MFERFTSLRPRGRRPRPGGGARPPARLDRLRAPAARPHARSRAALDQGAAPAGPRARDRARRGARDRRRRRARHRGFDSVHAARQAVLEQALRESLSLGHDWIGSEHILLALAKERDGVAARDPRAPRAPATERVRDETLRLMAAGDATRPRRRARRARGRRHRSARRLARFAGPFDPGAQAHLLLGLIAAGRTGFGVPAPRMGVTAEATRAALQRRLRPDRCGRIAALVDWPMPADRTRLRSGTSALGRLPG